jgi:beta-glucanase (GH16 family)
VPVALHFTKTSKSSSSNDALTPNKDGLYTNVPKMPDFPTLIDPDTPQAALTSKSLQDSSSDYTLVFSDEFNTEGRSFYPGDDPFWEGSSLHYWQTGDLEWYEPGQLTTKNGALEITLDHFDDISQNYNLSYRSGMMSTWNKVSFSV